MTKTSSINRTLVLELVRATEQAAIACAAWIGKGNEKAADAAAVEAMRASFSGIEMDGTVVIGEGERDEAPMLYIGEKVGTGNGPKIDIALDPLEGTTITAKGQPNSLATVAFAEDGNFLNAPDTYMEKIAIGGGYPDGIISLDKSAAENAKAIAAHKGCDVSEIVACVLERPRHAEIIKDLRDLGCVINLINDGDVAGAMASAMPGTGIDFYMGTGGAPEGVLAAAALRCLGGQFEGRLVFRNDDEKARAAKWGITDLNRKYTIEELAAGDVVFAATGVTDGNMVAGVRKSEYGGYQTETVVMRSSTKTIRWIKTDHAK
jgi:fructose-1,6-bisphosphatase II / sedoheptulose-1,7-bisphosphatase